MRGAALALLAVLALAPGAVAAQPVTSFNDVEDEVMCDTCNVPLNVADSPRADQERQVIRDLIAKGLTKDQIKAELKTRYGPAILATPQDSGFSLAVWWVPVAVVVGLLALVAALLPRWRRRPGSGSGGRGAPPSGSELSPAEARRLEEDLARYDV
ncbi:MAG TPA: cytochrome c-type biogenesis protein CcmH [Solirubrobacteraceae bacterium]